MTTVTRGAGRHQPGDSGGTENALIGALVLVVVLSIGALAYIVKLSGDDVGSVAPVAIPTIGAVGGAAISGIVVALRRRPARRRS
ncbi:hypothetical protein ACH5AJ_35170 [Streptomyces rochei]|uniref:hypothetical protein n=1 Tax=Streptomyces rochei TaxID=1928 RepID=UPI0037A76E6C